MVGIISGVMVAGVPGCSFIQETILRLVCLTGYLKRQMATAQVNSGYKYLGG